MSESVSQQTGAPTEGPPTEAPPPVEEPAESEAIEVEVIQEDEVMAEAQLWATDRPGGIKALRILLTVAAGAIAIFVGLRWPLEPGVWTLLIPLLLALAMGLRRLYFYLNLRAFRRRAPWEKRLRYRFTEEELASVIGAPEGSEQGSDAGKVHHRGPWRRVTTWQLREGAYYLMDAVNLHHWIPRSAFVSEAEASAFEALLGRAIKAAPTPEGGEARPAAESTSRSGKKALILWAVLVLLFIAIYQLVVQEPAP